MLPHKTRQLSRKRSSSAVIGTTPRISAATRLTPKELPRSVQIISDELIDAVDPYAIEDVLTLASNTAFLGDNDGRENSFVMRGFQGTPILRDGFRIETFGGISDPELFNVERIEVLKGPDSILYGESDPGGLVNMVVKRPLGTPHATLSLRSNSFGSFSPRVDAGGGGERMRFRLLGLYKNDDGWRDYDRNNKRTFLAPSVTFALGEATELTLIAEFTDDDYQADFGTAIDPGRKAHRRPQTGQQPPPGHDRTPSAHLRARHRPRTVECLERRRAVSGVRIGIRLQRAVPAVRPGPGVHVLFPGTGPAGAEQR